MSTVETAATEHTGGVAEAGRTTGLSGRMAVLYAVAGLVLQGVSAYLFYAVAGYSAAVNSDAVALLAAGGNSADLFRWANVADLFGYLLVAPLVVYSSRRFREDPRIALYTAGGFAYILVGALGAIIFLAAGPMLLRDYASASGAGRAAIATTFTTLYQIVVVGLWQTLEGIPGGVWLLGMGINLYRARSRAVALVPFALGGLYLVLAGVRMLGY
jgi:hypothetical protein